MAQDDSTADHDRLDHDPAASSMPRIPIRVSADLGQRAPQIGATGRLVTQQREAAAAEALVAVRNSWRRHGASYVLGVLEHVERAPVAATLAALYQDSRS